LRIIFRARGRGQIARLFVSGGKGSEVLVVGQREGFELV
jgi:hypothetical protein